ncbi:hypothetical protein WJX82_011488 [Trebouxia sp. C0006]
MNAQLDPLAPPPASSALSPAGPSLSSISLVSGFLQSRDGSHYAAAGSSSSAATRFLCNMPTEFQQT